MRYSLKMGFWNTHQYMYIYIYEISHDSGLKETPPNCCLPAMSPLPPQPSWVAKTPTPEVPPYYSPAAPPWRPAGLKPLSESLVFLSQVRDGWMMGWRRLLDEIVLFFSWKQKRCVGFWSSGFFAWMKVVVGFGGFNVGWSFFFCWLGFADGFHFGMMLVGWIVCNGFLEDMRPFHTF